MQRSFSCALGVLAVVVSSTASAQTAGSSGSTAPQANAPVRVPGSSVTVTAQKEPADPAALPVSVSTVTEDLMRSAGITFVSDAVTFSPNTHFSEFTARKGSNPRIRGIGASPANPGVVTYVDGVPQFNSNTSSFDLIGIGQIEFVRGAQSALWGRNALGGLINMTSVRPGMSKWSGNAVVPFGTENMYDVRANASGPIAAGKAAAGFSVVFGRRDGFSVNQVTGNDVDSRETFGAKGQLLWTPNSSWETRVILSGERARDGDYALNDLNAVRQNPFVVARDFEGRTNRDLFATTVQNKVAGDKLTFVSTTGFVDWKTLDETDIDYSPFPAATRRNDEKATQLTQEFRFASSVASPVQVSDTVGLRWQAGAFFSKQDYDQLATQSIAPFVLSPFINFPVVQTTPRAALEDTGVSIYSLGTLAFSNRFDLSVGARVDRETRSADLFSGFVPQISPDVRVRETRTFTDVSPQIAAAFRARPGVLIYGSAARAFKAGGFNPVSIPGSESYDVERAWNGEGGVKVTAANGRYSVMASAFSISWDDLQLNVAIPFVPGQFYIANVGSATSRGAEFEVNARAASGVDVFAGVGFTKARFGDGTSSQGVNVSDNKVPNTPAYTASFGVQFSRDLAAGGRVFGRLEVASFGEFEYDEFNAQRQAAYTLTNLRGGWRNDWFTVEAWVRNAGDTKYVPIAFAFPGMPSGYVGEPGRPRTAGISFGVGF